MGHEKVLHGFGLTGDRGDDTTDGAGSLNHGLLLLSWDTVPQTGQRGKGRTVCVCGYSKEL